MSSFAIRLDLILALGVLAFVTSVHVTAWPFTDYDFENRVDGHRSSPVPYHAAIVVSGPYLSAMCSGAIIGSRWVITAASCVVNSAQPEGFLPPAKIKVLAGISNVLELVEAAKKSSSKQKFAVESVIVHPMYSSTNRVNKKLTFYSKNDLVLLKLAQPMFTRGDQQIQEINLPGYRVPPPVGRAANASGFSKLEAGRSDSGRLWYAQEKVLPDDLCKEHYSLFEPSHMICATGRSNKICPGDYGGPLAICDPIQGCTLVGIKIFGLECGSRNPSYYLPVANFVDWINEKRKEGKANLTTPQPDRVALNSTRPQPHTTPTQCVTSEPEKTSQSSKTSEPDRTSRLVRTPDRVRTTEPQNSTESSQTTQRVTTPQTGRTTRHASTTRSVETTPPVRTTEPQNSTESSQTTQRVTTPQTGRTTRHASTTRSVETTPPVRTTEPQNSTESSQTTQRATTLQTERTKEDNSIS